MHGTDSPGIVEPQRAAEFSHARANLGRKLGEVPLGRVFLLPLLGYQRVQEPVVLEVISEIA